MSQSHFHLQGLELVGYVRLGLATHLLACPLLEPIELFIDVHSERSCLCEIPGLGSTVDGLSVTFDLEFVKWLRFDCKLVRDQEGTRKLAGLIVAEYQRKTIVE